MKLSLKMKTILGVSLFVVIFVGLLLVATFCDFQISELLTKGALAKGEYFATDFFGVLLECVGCIPIYLMIAFALCVLFWACLRVVREKNNTLGIVLAVLCAIGVVAACWYTVKDVMKYVFEHVTASVIATNGVANAHNVVEAIDKFRHTPALYAIEVVIGALIAAPSLLATKLFDRETILKLVKFIFATAIALVVANVLVMIVKDPVGRMRFRAINSAVGAEYINSGDVPGFTRWYVLNKQPSDAVLERFALVYGVDDAFKSFPSGHTCSAGTVYALIMIPDLFDFKGKNKNGATLACWIVPIVYTALVAISRIVVGAHYMSDVLFGGTFSFVAIVILREIVILKGAHFYSVFKKKAAVAVGEETATVEEQADGQAFEQAEETQIEAPAEEGGEEQYQAENCEEEGVGEQDILGETENVEGDPQ